MTNSSTLDKPVLVSLDWGTPFPIVGRSGELVVIRGSVWITREDDLEDYVLEAGGRVTINRGDAVLVQPWRRGEPVHVAWQSSGQSLASAYAQRVASAVGAVVAAAACALAVALRRAAQAVAAVGQRAAVVAAPVAFVERGPRGT